MPCAGPGIFYRDGIGREFSTGMKFWSTMANKAWCVPSGSGDISVPRLCTGIFPSAPARIFLPILTSPPWSWGCVCHCHPPVASCPQGGDTQPHVGSWRGMWGWVPLRGGHTFLGGSMGMICSIFLWGGIGGEGSLRDPGRFLGGLEGPGGIG